VSNSEKPSNFLRLDSNSEEKKVPAGTYLQPFGVLQGYLKPEKTGVEPLI
jgi:hypothetical protein